MFKSLVGRGHPEFSTNHQQDAQEYFLHLMDILDKSEKDSQVKLNDCFTFQFEDRIQCCSSNRVRYKKRKEMIFDLPICVDDASNKNEYDQFLEERKEAEKNKERINPESVVRLKIPFDACLNRFFESENIHDYCSNIEFKKKITVTKCTRFATFPEYLAVQLRKFTISEDWTPTKLDVSVPVPDELDLSNLRSSGLQPNEEELPDDDENSQQELEINAEYLSQLMDMGFPHAACQKAIHFTNNQGVEAAMNWVFEHSQDADFASPLQLQSSAKKKEDVNPESVMMIVSMGFSEAQAKKALKKSQNNVEAAAEWIFTHMDELDDTMEVDELVTEDNNSKICDGNGKYRLFGFISHMGTSTSCGHYVCHIMKDNRWVIYNDRKVAVSENPPKDLGYLYFYKRVADSS